MFLVDATGVIWEALPGGAACPILIGLPNRGFGG